VTPGARLRLDAAGLRRARAHAQLLTSDAELTDPTAVTAALTGVQAQDELAAALAIRARSTGLVRSDVGKAVQDRSLVLTWSLRGTRHLHAADDVRWLVRLLGPTVLRRTAARRRQLGVEGAAGDQAVRAVRRTLRSRGRLTRAQVRALVARHGIDPAGQAPVHVLHRAALEGVLCVVPDPDAGEAYVLLDDWVAAAEPLPDRTAAAQLVRRYLAGHGPATHADFRTWSGLAAGDVQAAWADVAGDLTEVATVTGPAWLLTEHLDAAVAAQGQPVPVRLLPAFDPLLLGYADRRFLFPSDRARAVNAGGGLIRPTVLGDRGVVATWRHRGKPAGSDVEVTPFGGLSARLRDAIEGEVRDIGRFVGAAAEPVATF
jgi:hypothetical protein